MCGIARSYLQGTLGREQFRERVTIDCIIARELFLGKKTRDRFQRKWSGSARLEARLALEQTLERKTALLRRRGLCTPAESSQKCSGCGEHRAPDQASPPAVERRTAASTSIIHCCFFKLISVSAALRPSPTRAGSSKTQ